jgi:rod shape-determining protein MreB
MSLLSLFKTKEIAIDLGTANTRIVQNGRVEIEEPSCVAIDRRSGELVTAGKHALTMIDSDSVRFISPLQGGVVAYFHAAELMLTDFLHRMNCKPKSLFSPAFKVLVSIPAGTTEAEERIIGDLFKRVGFKKVRYVHKPMVAAIAMGLDVFKNDGKMIVDVGSGTSEIAVIALGGIVIGKSLKTAGDKFNTDIVDFMRSEHNVRINKQTAGWIKTTVGAAMPDIDNPPPNLEIEACDLTTHKIKNISITHHEIAMALDASISEIETSILKMLKYGAPNELVDDIMASGIFLTGGSSLLRGLDKRISLKTKLPVHTADKPLQTVIQGNAILLQNWDRFSIIVI